MDFLSLFNHTHQITPNSIEALKTIVHDHFKWPFFNFPPNKSLQEHLWRVRSYFQSLHPIGIGYIEGNHRAVLTCKLLYGQKVNAAYPLMRPFPPIEDEHSPKKKKEHTKSTPDELRTRTKNNNPTTTLPAKSPLYVRTLDTKIIVPVMGEDY